jgi:regulator of protease activity HflC (stomatin/prohibitin superfamily)
MVEQPELLESEATSKRKRWWRFVERHLPIVVIYLMVATLVGFIIAPNVIITVPSGHVGLLWKRFRGGTQLDPRLLKEEGLRVLLPWDKLFLYDLRLQTTTDTYNAISQDGVNLAATINIRFRLKHDSIPQLHQGIGPDYIARLVRPEIGNRAREIIAEYTAEEVYSTKRQEIQKRIRTHTEAMLGQSTMERTKEESEYGEHYRVTLDAMLNLYDTLILGLELPQPVINAINRKVEQYYLVQEYAFRVEREKKESERKLIEAQGIRAFQETVSQGISDSYVRWRGIEATLQLAQSNNAKIVIIGSGRDGLPIILGNVDSPIPAKPATTPEGDAAPAERTTGQSPPPVEKTPATNLTTPSEKSPPADQKTPPAGTAAPGASDKRSEAQPKEPQSLWLTEIEALLSKVVGSSASPAAPTTAPKSAPGATPPQPAAAGARPAAAPAQ